MENLSLIAAIGKNNELGFNNKLIWRIPEDLRFYRSMTLYENIIMGRKTFESMPTKALEKRTPFVISRSILDQHFDVNSYRNIEDLLSYIEATPEQNFIVVGGSQIYTEFLPFVDTMYLTEIEDYAEADAFFPEIDIHEWNAETIFEYKTVNKWDVKDISYTRNKYVRRRKR